MSIELSILELISLSMGHAWSLLQWWASVSFGLIALAHFSSTRLTRLLVATLLALYALFSVFLFFNLQGLVGEILGYVDDLVRLGESQSLTAAAITKVELFHGWRGLVSGIIMFLCFAGTFIGTSVYVLHTYRRGLSGSDAGAA